MPKPILLIAVFYSLVSFCTFALTAALGLDEFTTWQFGLMTYGLLTALTALCAATGRLKLVVYTMWLPVLLNSIIFVPIGFYFIYGVFFELLPGRSAYDIVVGMTHIENVRFFSFIAPLFVSGFASWICAPTFFLSPSPGM